MTNQSIAAGKRFAKAAAATVIAFFILVSVFASVVFAADGSNGEEVTILLDSQEIAITTTETEPIEILTTAGISVSESDMLDLSGYQEGEGGVITVKTLKSVNVERGGVINSYSVYGLTVGEAMSELGIAPKADEKLNYTPEAELENGMLIKLMPTFTVKISADGKKEKLTTTKATVKDILNQAGITLDSDDYVKPSLKTVISKKTTVKVYRVSYKNKTVTKKIKYKTKTVKDDDLNIGETKVVTKGKNGKKKITYRVKYVNGKKINKTKINTRVTKKATQKVVKVGTKAVKGNQDTEPNGVTSTWGLSVGQEITGRYTHYCACATCNGSSSGTTSSGRHISNGMENPYYIACNWLPLGSVLNVDGVNYLVVDRGGSGLSPVGRIDIFTPEGHAACYRYGTGSCKIVIVRLGW